MSPGGVLTRLARLGVTQPLPEPVASDDAHYLASKGTWKVAMRTLRRMAELRASGQRPLLREAIDPRWRRALWIHEEAPQIGDALMDLAPRSLLAERGITTDLHAAAPIARLYRGDRLFAACLDGDAVPDARRYDFVIAASHSAAALAVKRRHLAALPWVSLKGYYGAYDYQRGCFTALRLAQLLGIRLDAEALGRHARQKLDIDAAAPLAPAAAGELRIAIAVGGVRAERSYSHWAAVIDALRRRSVAPTLVLVGSANGKAMAAQIRSAAAADIVVHDYVDRLDLATTRAAIGTAGLLLCADGGLMHLGLTTPTPLVALFPSNIDPAWRLPPDFDGAWLRAATPYVDAIDPDAVATQAAALVAERLG